MMRMRRANSYHYAPSEFAEVLAECSDEVSTSTKRQEQLAHIISRIRKEIGQARPGVSVSVWIAKSASCFKHGAGILYDSSAYRALNDSKLRASWALALAENLGGVVHIHPSVSPNRLGNPVAAYRINYSPYHV